MIDRRRRRKHAKEVVDALDALSRKRALSDRESRVLEHYIAIADGKPLSKRAPPGTTRVLASIGVGRDMQQYVYPHTPHTAAKGTSRDRLRKKIDG